MIKECDPQREMFGKRYLNAKVEKLWLPRGDFDKLLTWLRKPENFLVVLGPPGTGKTYLCSAVLSMLRDVTKSIAWSWSSDWSGQNPESDLYLLEDIKHSEDFVAHDVIMTRYDSMKPTVITSGLTEEELYKEFGDRICSRLFATENLVIDMHGMQDLRTCGK